MVDGQGSDLAFAAQERKPIDRVIGNATLGPLRCCIDAMRGMGVGVCSGYLAILRFRNRKGMKSHWNVRRPDGALTAPRMVLFPCSFAVIMPCNKCMADSVALQWCIGVELTWSTSTVGRQSVCDTREFFRCALTGGNPSAVAIESCCYRDGRALPGHICPGPDARLVGQTSATFKIVPWQA